MARAFLGIYLSLMLVALVTPMSAQTCRPLRPNCNQLCGPLQDVSRSQYQDCLSMCDSLPICQPPQFTVGGTISGVTAGNSVTLVDNADGTVLGTVTQGNGPFTFSFRLYTNGQYNVTVQERPSGQTCTVGSGSGTVRNANVTNISVQCSTPPDKIDCDPYVCTSEKSLATTIANALNGKVTGYVVIVGSQPPSYGGMARTSVDPPATTMNPDLLMQIASISKPLTTVGVLKELETLGLNTNNTIWQYIYPDWLASNPMGIKQLTFANMLTHTSGFPNNSTGQCQYSTYAELQALVQAGVTLPASPQYSNCNFAIFRELLPIMEGFTILDYPPFPFLIPPQVFRPPLSADLYIQYMNNSVFAPVGVGTNRGGVLCKPPAPGPTDVLSYPNPAGTSPGTDRGDMTLGCGGGGWVMTANEVFKVINDLARGSTLLSSAQESNMRTSFFGWDNAVFRNCGNPPDPLNVCKNGGYGNPSANPPAPVVATYAGILNCSIPVVVFANSAVSNFLQPNTGGDIIDLVSTAYSNVSVACQNGPTQICQCP